MHLKRRTSLASAVQAELQLVVRNQVLEVEMIRFTILPITARTVRLSLIRILGLLISTSLSLKRGLRRLTVIPMERILLEEG